MATRTIRQYGDEILTKKCKKVTEMTPRISQLIDDMLETMQEANGVGLAAPQVGVLKQVVVIDVSGETEEEQEEGQEKPQEEQAAQEPIVLINPEILETSGEQTGQEGCLSVPGKYGIVTRPDYVKVKAYNREMEPIEVEGTELLARALCHELDHLEGKMYVELAQDGLHDVLPPEEEEEEQDS